MNRPLDRHNNFDLMVPPAAVPKVYHVGASRFHMLMLELTRGTYKVGQRTSALVPSYEAGSIQPTEYDKLTNVQYVHGRICHSARANIASEVTDEQMRLSG